MYHDVDAAIVGAGPSGAWAAYRLARGGARVTLFDASHPREKPCGGGVTRRALALVNGAVDRRALPSTAIRTARFVDTTAGREAIVPLPGDALIVASRAAFDGALLDAPIAAGATLSRARVVDVVVTGRGARIATTAGTFDADYVIGADGANSLVRRRLAQPFRRDQLSTATGFFARGVTATEIVLELFSDPPGYVWSFPRPDHLAIGICAQADAGVGTEALRKRTAGWIDAARLAPGARLDAYSWPIPSLDAHDFGRLTTGGARWCLTGDAAGLVDPITREGIFFAIASGGWAADAILSGSGDQRMYHARVHDEAAAELSRAARLKARFFQRRFTRLLVAALQDSAAIRSVMADLIAGEQPYRTLKWRLLKTLELGLAWKAARTPA
jgi:geranylgeranyl reductase family protein